MEQWRNSIKSLSAELYALLRDYLLEQIVTTNDGFDIKDSELGEMASACTTLEAALSLVVDHRYFQVNEKNEVYARDLVKAALKRQHVDGALGQPFYILPNQPETKDIAEVGASADALYYLYRYANAKEAKDVLLGTARFLLAMKHPLVPGVYYKRPDAKEHDVLNGDVYAGASLMRTYQVTGDKVYHELALEVAKHIMNRFGVHTSGWWPYAEKFDGSISVGNSLSYQATIVAFGHDILAGLEDKALQNEFAYVLDCGMEKILECIEKDLPLKEVEPVWWASTWNRCPEVLLALVKERHLDKARKYALIQLEELISGAVKDGISYFTPPKKAEADEKRTPVSTTFRKATTLSGIISYALMDLEERG